MNPEARKDKGDSPTLILPGSGSPKRIIVQKSKLFVLSGPFQGREFMVDRDAFSIGSGPHNDLVLPDSTVSRHHCEIQRTPAGHIIRDMGSTNGTIVQGVRATEALLEEGTEFQLGETRIVFCPLHETMEYVLSSRESFGGVVGRSIAMRRVFHQAETYAPTDATILIEGETGTGKEILAEEIHRHSKRANKPFVIIDCGALAEDLVTSEFFGHVRGAFTGAGAERAGAFEHADGGTVMLDEISSLSSELQPKLLRVLEKREFKRVGSNEVRKVDVRILAATNRRLEGEVNAGRFREDLYYRCSVVHIELPPLRKRKEDIPLLTETFLKEFYGKDALSHVADFDRTMQIFANYDWPGNVRELRNVVELASYSGKQTFDLASFLSMSRMAARAPDTAVHTADRPFKEAKDDLVRAFEKDYIRDLLRKHDGNISQAAREAKIERTYLQRLVRKHGLK